MSNLDLDDATFRAQFDRESKDYHGGDAKVVAIGGQRVPESMKSELPEHPIEAPVVVDYGKEYNDLMQQRKDLDSLKKAINAVNGAIGVMLVDMTDVKRVEKRDEAVTNLKKFHDIFPVDSEWGQEITNIAEAAVADPETLKKGISSMATTTTRKIMATNKAGLARIKEIKKNHKA